MPQKRKRQPARIKPVKISRERSSVINYANLFDEIDTLSDERRAKFNESLYETKRLRSLGVKIPDLRKIAKKYQDLPLHLFLGSNYFEYRFLFFTIGLRKLDSLKEQVDFIIKNKNLLISWALTDSIVNEFHIDTLKKTLAALKAFITDGSEYLIRLSYVILIKFASSPEQELYDFVTDNDSLIVKKAIAWLYSYLFISDEERMLNDAKRFSLETRKLIVQKVRESLRVSKEKKDHCKSVLLLDA